MYTHKKAGLKSNCDKGSSRGSAFVVGHFEVAHIPSTEINITVNSKNESLFSSMVESGPDFISIF